MTHMLICTSHTHTPLHTNFLRKHSILFHNMPCSFTLHPSITNTTLHSLTHHPPHTYITVPHTHSTLSHTRLPPHTLHAPSLILHLSMPLTSPQLMEMPSLALSPVAPVLFSRSLPARSTKWNFAVSISTSPSSTLLEALVASRSPVSDEGADCKERESRATATEQAKESYCALHKCLISMQGC